MSSIGGNSLGSLLPMLLVLGGFMYFMVIRPQNRKQQEQQKLLEGLKAGDEVVTIGGILGTITKFDKQYVILQVASQSNLIIQKSAVAQVLPKGTIAHAR